MELPQGTVTYLFTDVQGSTKLWEEAPDLMLLALGQHDDVIDRAVAANHGVSVKPRGEGDSHFIVFQDAVDGISAAKDIQQGLVAVEWPTPTPLLVRIAIHTGVADLRSSDYYGSTVNRAARLRALAHGGQTIISAATSELVKDSLPPGVALRDLGQHGLKDLARPEHVFQVDIEGLVDTFPPLNSLEAIPNNLPLQLTEFVGRVHEIEDLKAALEESRLVTILAPGGAGKTRLAIQVAADLTADFPDGVFFIDLAPITSPDDIVQTVAESVGIALSTDEELLRQLLAYLRGKTQLLVFDNFEHVTEGAGALAQILAGALDVRVIATSRSKLNIRGEKVMVLPGMETVWDVPAEALQTSGVQLFVEAAKRADASFSLSGIDLDPLAKILELVEGMPLGIELAAAWIDVLPVDEIARELATSLDLLETESTGVPDRHRSIRAVFDYSWAMLTADERQVFSGLSTFRGGFTRDAAMAVAGASLRSLSNLAAKSLLIPDRDSGRYHIHELLRQYAEAELVEDTEQRRATESAHRAFYSNLAETIEESLLQGGQTSALHDLEEDIDNMRSAWRSSQRSSDGQAARKMMFPMWFLYEIRGWHQAGVAFFEGAKQAFMSEPMDEATQAAHALAGALEAWFVSLLGDPEVGTNMASEAVERLAGLSDAAAQVMAIQSQCAGLTYMSRWEDLRAASSAAVRIADEAADEYRAAELKIWLAVSELRLGNVDSAAELVKDAENVLSRLGDYRARLWNLPGLAMPASLEGRTQEAISFLSQMVAGSKEVGYRRAAQMGLQYLGEEQLEAGQFEAADASFLESLSMSDEMGQEVETAGMLARIAQVRARQGEKAEAVEILASVLTDSSSDQSMMVEDTPIRELATDLLATLRQELDDNVYKAAYGQGRARPMRITAKRLLAAPTPIHE